MRGTHEALDQERGARTGATRRRGRRMLPALIALLGLAPLLLAACGPNAGANGVEDPNGVFVWPYYPYYQPQDPSKLSYMHYAVLDPAVNQDLYDAATISMLFTNLVTFDGNLNIIPDAITKMPDVDPTGTIYTFHLRPNMKFSDGQPITAGDFAYSIDRALDPHLCDKLDVKTYSPQQTDACDGPPGPYYLRFILGANQRAGGQMTTPDIGHGNDANHGLNVIDDQTLQIRLTAPISFFLDALAYPTSSVVEKSFIEQRDYAGGLWVDHLDKGGCSGPFQVQSYGQGKQLTMVPNPNWEAAWGTTIHFRAVERPIVDSQDSEYTNYRAGQYDYTDVPADEYSRARSQSDFYEEPTLETDYFGVNFRIPPFDEYVTDKSGNQQHLVAQAFDLALNKQYLVDSIEDGGAIPTNHIIPKGMPGYTANLKNPAPDGTESITGNQAAALQLLKQARAQCQGPADQQPDFCPYIATSNPKEIDIYVSSAKLTRINLANAAARAWSSLLGLNVAVKPVGKDFGLVASHDSNTGASTNPFPLWMLGWIADYPDPQDWTSLQFQTTSPFNYGAWGSQTFDHALNAADTEPDPTKRLTMYNQLEQQAVDSCAWIPYQQGKGAWRLRPWVHGFTLNSLLLITDTSWANVSIQTHGS